MPNLIRLFASLICTAFLGAVILPNLSNGDRFSDRFGTTLGMGHVDLAHSTVIVQDAQPTALPEEEPVEEPEDAPESTTEPTFEGRWYTHIAQLDLVQDGTQVTGTVAGYDGNWNFEIAGTVSDTGVGNILAVSESDVVGAFALTLSDDGQLIRGTDEEPMNWCGVRDDAFPDDALPDGCGYSGTWSIFSQDYITPIGSYLELVQTRGVVTGTLLSLEQTPLQTIKGEVKWGKGYQLLLSDIGDLESLSWSQNGHGLWHRFERPSRSTPDKSARLCWALPAHRL